VLPLPNKPPLDAGCEPLPPPNIPPLPIAVVVGVLEAGAGFVDAAPNRGFCSAGLEAVLPNNPPPPVAGVELALALALALPKEKVGVPVACPNRLVVAAGVDDVPNRAPDVGVLEVVALLVGPAELAGVPKVKDMMSCWRAAQECGLISSSVKIEWLLVKSHSILILTSLASEVN
jgi:hypothetical protein